jgi:NADH:ubiquinone oxidoreductase subunit F (NADH-binding)
VSIATADPRARQQAKPVALPRLLMGLHTDRAISFEEHMASHGPLPRGKRHDLIAAVDASGLRGRGGAGFPAGKKLRAVAERRGRPVVVANATEGEPISGKDRVLLSYAPHLVLDGAVAVADALGAREAIVAVTETAKVERAALLRAIEARKRTRADGRVSLRLVSTPEGFVVGEETALVNHLNGGPGKPTFKPPLPFERGVGGAPTLVQNAETLAHIALIARFGPEWFREVGTEEEPGSVLLTVSGAVGRPGVHEVALGTPLAVLLAAAGEVTETPRAFLIGGYFGTWVAVDRAEGLVLSAAALGKLGASLGAGGIFVLPASACGVVESARVIRFLADESAGQCGPCVHGLAAIAGGFERLVRLDRADVRPELERWLELVKGRGACRHPDGAVRFALSALAAFSDEVEHHVRHGRCASRAAPVLPVPPRHR